jgi:hypothetical protein
MGVSGFRGHRRDLRRWTPCPAPGASSTFFQEIIADGTTAAGECTGNGDVTEFAYHGRVSEAFKNGSLAGLSSLPEAMPLQQRPKRQMRVLSSSSARGRER